MAGDPDFNSVVLLMNMDGTNGGTDAVDHSNSAHSITYSGGITLTNAQTLHQATSLGQFDRTDDYIEAADNADFEPGSGEYTCEIRCRTGSSVTGQYALVSHWHAGIGEASWHMEIQNGALRFVMSTNGSVQALALSGGTVSTNTDYEFAWDVDSGGTIRLYVNGAVVASGARPGAFNDSARPLRIGSYALSTGANQVFNGYVYEVRLTKGVSRYGGAYTPSGVTYATFLGQADIRVSQQVIYAAQEIVPDIRVSQMVSYVGFKFDPVARVSQQVMYAGVAALTPKATQKVTCLRITRTDGQVFRFTTHDRDIYIAGETFVPCDSFSRSAYELSSLLDETDNVDVTGLIADGAITQADLFAGAFDGATVDLIEVDWGSGSPVTTRTLVTGTAGKLDQTDTTYKFEIVTAAQKLQAKGLLQTVTPSCRWELGSANTAASPGCGVDLSALEVSGTVTAVGGLDDFNLSPLRVFTDSGRAEATDFFKLGKVTWVTGGNAGLTSEVKEFASGQFTLWQELRTAIEVGDTYTATPGCNKLVDGDCLNKFSNVENHGGFPFLPGRDFLTKRADR